MCFLSLLELEFLVYPVKYPNIVQLNKLLKPISLKPSQTCSWHNGISYRVAKSGNRCLWGQHGRFGGWATAKAGQAQNPGHFGLQRDATADPKIFFPIPPKTQAEIRIPNRSAGDQPIAPSFPYTVINTASFSSPLPLLPVLLRYLFILTSTSFAS